MCDLDELEWVCNEKTRWPTCGEVLSLIERCRSAEKALASARWNIYLAVASVEWDEGDVAILDGDNVRALDAEARRDPAVAKKIEEDLEEAREEMEKDRRRGEN